MMSGLKSRFWNRIQAPEPDYRLHTEEKVNTQNYAVEIRLMLICTEL